MGKTRAAYPPEFRRQMVELVRAGRSPPYLPQSQPRTAAADLVLPPPGDLVRTMAPDQTDPNAACAPSSQLLLQVLRRPFEPRQLALIAGMRVVGVVGSEAKRQAESGRGRGRRRAPAWRRCCAARYLGVAEASDLRLLRAEPRSELMQFKSVQ